MIYTLYNIDSQVRFNYDPESHCVHATYYNLPSGKFILTNRITCGDLFNGLALGVQNGNTRQLTKNGIPVACVELVGNGLAYRFYNAPTKEAATMIHACVVGDADYDYISANLQLEVEKRIDGNFVITNLSEINGYSWLDVPLNREVKKRNGVRWAITKVGATGATVYVAQSTLGYNQQGGGRPEYIVIGTNPSTDLDYLIKASDVSDPDTEELVFTHVRFTKNECTPLRIKISDILAVTE